MGIYRKVAVLAYVLAMGLHSVTPVSDSGSSAPCNNAVVNTDTLKKCANTTPIVSPMEEEEPTENFPDDEIAENDYPDVCSAMDPQSPPGEDEVEMKNFVRSGDLLILRKNVRAGSVATGSFRAYVWPNNVVPYALDGTITNNITHQGRIEQAMSDIENAIPNCVKFRPRSARDKYYVKISDESKIDNCYSAVGYLKRPAQPIELNSDCSYGTIVHTLIHTLGFLHEHGRDDRDDYVDIHFDNIKRKHWKDFVKDKEKCDDKFPYMTEYYKVPYNFDSIMHDPEFSNVAVDEDFRILSSKYNSQAWGDPDDVGQRNKFSHGDLLMIARRHGCPDPKREEMYLTYE